MKSSMSVLGFVVVALSSVVPLSDVSAQGVRIDRAGGYSCDIVADTSGKYSAVIYCPPSGAPDKLDIRVAYSTNGGAAWCLFGPFNQRQLDGTTVGVDAPPNLFNSPVYCCWNEYVHLSESSPLTMVLDGAGFPNGSFQRSLLPRSDTNGTQPFIAVNPYNPNCLLYGGKMSDNLYRWISTDGGYHWSDRILWVQAQGRYLSRPHFRFGNNRYVFATFTIDTTYNGIYTSWPYYTESSNGGTTWTAPKPMWSLPPYDSACAGRFNCIVTNGNLPLIVGETMKRFASGGDVWFFYPESGGMGNRSWRRDLLRGNGQGAVVASYSAVAHDMKSDLIAVSWCEDSSSHYDIHISWSCDLGRNWAPPAHVTNDGTHESALKMSHYLGQTSGGNRAVASMVYIAGSDIFFIRFDQISLAVGAEPRRNNRVRQFLICPTIARGKIRFMIPDLSRVRNLTIYDVGGKIVKDMGPLTRTSRWREVVLNPGIYFVRLEVNDHVLTKKVVVVE